MAKDKNPYPDEFIFGITRGACPPAQRHSARVAREVFETEKTFEETYPSYPFSELVRLAIGLGHWLGRAGRGLRQGFAQSARSRKAGTRTNARRLSRPVSSSHG